MHVFVAGLHRSGTSLLHELIREHPDVTGFHDSGVWEDEGQHLQTVMRPASEHGGPTRFALDLRSHLTERSGLATPAYRERLRREWAAHWEPGRPVRVEKSPPDLVRTRFLQWAFPDARFVVLVRHPLATSLATHRMSGGWLPVVAANWVAAHRRFRRDRPRLNHVLVVRYEDLTGDPDGTLHRIWRFLDLDEHPVSTGHVRPDVNERYQQMWRQRPALERALVGWMVRGDLRPYGYGPWP